MEPDHLGYDANSGEEKSLMQLFYPDFFETDDLFGERQMDPRIGDEFQVEIPPMITGSEYIQLLMNPTDSDDVLDVSHFFLMGLSIPIIWLCNEVSDEDELLKYKKRKCNRTNSGKKTSELTASEVNDRKEPETKNNETKFANRTKLDKLSKRTFSSPVPGLLGDPWDDAEKENFLLGLYVFGKNFFQIKRFIETKEMGDILSFYYGEFYRSAGYRRWTDCRKPRSRKCVYGRKIFSGWRQQELVSRLLRQVPEESKPSLLEVSKSFAEGRTSLESYVSALKAIIGIHALVESVGIGKGKEDLTSLTMEPVKTKQVFSLPPTMPSGKAFSTLTSQDIIKYLTGDFRLSKARCNDIFWEAVWPRLLARGWHSEQPRNRGYVSSKDYLVFLVPGVKKFSRRKLVKGDHYFDSVSDILKKVASEPKLIELEAEEARTSSCNEEDQWVLEELSDQDQFANRRPHCYLKPLSSNCNLERMKFMVVDSSLVQQRKSSKVRELRYLPIDFSDAYKLTHLVRKNRGSELDEVKMPLKGEKNISTAKNIKDTFLIGCPKSMKFMVVDSSSDDAGKSSKSRTLRYCKVESKIPSDMSFISRIAKEGSSVDSMDEHQSDTAVTKLSSEADASDSPVTSKIYNSSFVAVDGAISNEKAHSSDSGKNVEIHRDQKASYSEEKKSSNRMIKLHFSRRPKTDSIDSLAPLVKRRRLIACARTESCSIGSKAVGPPSALDLPVSHNDVFEVVPSLDKSSSLTCPEGENPEEEISSGRRSGSCFNMEISDGKNEKLRSLSSIGLKLSQLPSDSDNREVLMMEVESSHSMTLNGSHVYDSKLTLEGLNTSVDVNTAAQQPDMNLRRQSTRNRPLTAKALEALACGFLNIKKKQSTKDYHSREITFSNPSRKTRSKLRPSSKRGIAAGKVFVDWKIEKESNETSLVCKSTVGQPDDQYEVKRASVTSGII